MKTLYDWKVKLIIVRGLPGSGKSSLAKSLVADPYQIVENDHYWLLHDGTNYKYEKELQEMAGWWCWSEAFRRFRTYNLVVVSNVFVHRHIILGYLEPAKRLGINVEIMEPNTPWAKNPVECHKRCQNGAPLEFIERMAKNWSEVSQDEVNAFLSGTDEDFIMRHPK